MAIALITSTVVGSVSGDTITTSAINTTGANLLIVVVSDYSLGGGTVVSDSKGNTWTPRTIRTAPAAQIQIYYSIPSSVGSGHTFTGTGTASFPSLAVMAFSGAAAASPYDVENGALGVAVSTLATGSVTPSVNGELLIAAISVVDATGTITIDNGFTVQEQTLFAGGAHIGIAGAYLVQGSAGAINPAFSWTSLDSPAAAIATFKPAAAASTLPWLPVTKAVRGPSVAMVPSGMTPPDTAT